MKLKEIFGLLTGSGGRAGETGAAPAAIPEGEPPGADYLLSFEQWIGTRAGRLSHNLRSGWLTEWDLIFVGEEPMAYHLEWMPVKKSRITVMFTIPTRFGSSGRNAIAAAAQRGLFSGAPMKPAAVVLVEGMITGSYSVDPSEVLRRNPA